MGTGALLILSGLTNRNSIYKVTWVMLPNRIKPNKCTKLCRITVADGEKKCDDLEAVCVGCSERNGNYRR